ncbi:probable ADP-ribosylation factor GTPase-activating protein AGD5 [Morus notabilis]|uniref:probable ADP-ribosylation factor GTPase-activating protein AGD5 n=1 Tax=Morus notabilis TaxID=981085 RepID=UPI000CECEF9F|nr:probable ADP-ribosylation factor GTPase-activating protein AGD5 [Morus notabilis]
MSITKQCNHSQKIKRSKKVMLRSEEIGKEGKSVFPLYNPQQFKLESMVTPVPKPQEVQKVEPVVRQPEATEQVADTAPVATPPKVDYATDLFNMLSMDGPNENGSETASADDNAWAGFQSAQEASTAEKTVPPKPVESSNKSNSGLEDLFKDTPIITPSVSEKPQKDVKNDIMSLFEKVSSAFCFLIRI